MNIRPFGWRDVKMFYGYRDHGLFLDSTRVLIHGPVLIPVGAFLTFLGPTTRIFTYRCETSADPGLPLIAQLSYEGSASYARFSFLAPEKAVEMADLSALSDFMAEEMGKRGAFHILADIDESSPVYQMLRRVGFAIYARQRVWRLDGEALGEAEDVDWMPCRPGDVIGARSLYCNVVPGLVQQVEPLPKKNLKGMVYYQHGDLRAFVEIKNGRYGIWVQPFVNPDAQGFERHLVHLLRNLPGRSNRPLFICVRSYQSWLDSAIESMGAQPGPQHAAMVRHLTVARLVKQAYPLPAINGTRAEPTAPIARINDTPFLERSEKGKHPSTNSVR